MELPRVLVATLDFFKFLWASFFTKNKSIKPFRLLNLPSLAHDAVFSEMQIRELYHLSKCSRRSRYAVKMFTRRQKYYFEIDACKLFGYLGISNRFDIKSYYGTWRSDRRQPRDKLSFFTDAEDFWVATKKELVYYFDVFTKEVDLLWFIDSTLITKMTEILKENTHLPVNHIRYTGSKVDDEMYKYLLREYKDAKKLDIIASPSAGFRFDDMEPFTGDYIWMNDADWLTVDHLTRCFTNVERVRLGLDSKKGLNVLVFNQFLKSWRNGLRVGKLDLLFGCINFDLQSIFENVPTTKVRRVELKYGKRVSNNGEYFLIRQEESGMEAVVCLNIYCHLICFTTCFRLLRNDESY